MEELLDDHLKTDEPYPNAGDYDPQLHGLKGWLAFLGFSLIASLFITVYSNVKTYAPIVKNFTLLSSKTKVGVVIEGTLLIILALLQVSLLYLYFNKRRIFPRVFIGYLIFYLAFIFIDNLVLVRYVNGTFDATAFIKPVVYVFVWTLYILNSRRVNHTFLY
jgi:hypothetical protein